MKNMKEIFISSATTIQIFSLATIQMFSHIPYPSCKHFDNVNNSNVIFCTII